jgi:hypothetical protein
MRIPTILLVLAIGAAAPAAAQDYPKLKSGQWEVTTTTAKAPPNAPVHKVTQCTDEAVQKQMIDMGKGMQREMCSKSDFRRDGASWVGDSVCQMGESKMVGHTVMTFQGDSAYKTVMSTKYDPPFMGMKESSATMEGKYVGACRDGLVPGDMVMPDGRKMNIKNMGLPPAMPPARPKAPQ